ncbi:MAG TPA: hypothetical protein VGG61_06010 [Gemmataceae bacterium]
MSDDVFDHPDLNDLPVKLWAPSSALRGRLLLGTVAALAFGGLGAAAALTERGQAQAQGVTPALMIVLISMFPLAGVLWSFLGIARDLDGFSLRKSSSCALGVIFLWHLLIIRSESVLPGWGNVIVLGAIAVALVVLLIVAFASPGKSRMTGVEGTTDSSTGSKAGWGGVGLALLFLLKFASHFLLKLKFKQETWEALILLLLGLCTIGFFLQFALCKIQLRAKLGSVATVLGMAEILGMIACGIFAAYVILDFQEAQRSNFDDKMMEDLDAYWTNIALAVVAGVYLAWSSLTALFFAILWNRQDPEADWLRDLRDAESAC